MHLAQCSRFADGVDVFGAVRPKGWHCKLLDPKLNCLPLFSPCSQAEESEFQASGQQNDALDFLQHFGQARGEHGVYAVAGAEGW